MIDREDLYLAVPKDGAERMAQVLAFMWEPNADVEARIEAAARALLAYEEWAAGRTVEERRNTVISVGLMVSEIRATRAKHKQPSKGAKTAV